jgi:drug/metabolite transporter (DMT)-like permease
MMWILASALAAVLFTVQAVISKELMDHIDSVDFTAIYSLVAFIFYTPVFIYYISRTNPEFTPFLLLLIGLSGLGNILGMLAYNYGLGHTSLSIAMPLNRVQPVVVATIGFLVLGEAMNLQKVSGIVLVTVASYIILLEDHRNPLDPLTNILDDYGAQLALLSAVFFSITSIIDRFVTVQVPPELYTYFILGIMTASLNLYIARKNDQPFRMVKNEILGNRLMYALSGVITAGAYLSIYTGFSLAEASKVVPVLQLQVPLTVIAGREVFSEQHVFQKLLGSGLMILGILLVV